MKKSLAIVMLVSLCACVSQGRRNNNPGGDPPPPVDEKPTSEGDLPDDATCLPAVSWQEAIEGRSNNRILAQVFAHPENPHVERLVQLAAEGKANCPTP